MQINGHIEGIKKSILESLILLYDIKISKGQVLSEDLVSVLTEATGSINREIAVYINRKGRILDVRVGDDKSVSLSPAESKRGETGLTEVRCIHTHPSGKSTLSELDISTLKLFRLDMMVAIGVSNKKVTEVSAGIWNWDMQRAEIFGPYSSTGDELNKIADLVEQREKLGKELVILDNNEAERALLIGLETPETPIISGVSEVNISLAELKELAQTAGAVVVDTLLQKRSAKDSAFLIGKGKLNEISQIAQAKEIDLLIFDEELSGSQLRNIEAITNANVIDRTGLILDIFAKRAKSREGRVQVELAQLNYLMPRLQGRGTALSRLGGGIGTRGPGETKLETDRRHIRKRVDFLKSELEAIKRQRQTARREREKNKIPVVALVGYTNAGKSTLLNSLCTADVFAEDKLFATLDTTTRKLELDENTTVLLSDTVGFIRKLPHHLVEAFKATIEEAVLADLLLIVADASDQFSPDHIRVVDELLSDLGASCKPSILVWNKWDKVNQEFHTPFFKDKRKEINVSAITGEGLEQLKETIKNSFIPETEELRLDIPFSQGWVLPYLYSNGVVKSVCYEEKSSIVDVKIDKKCIDRIRPFIAKE